MNICEEAMLCQEKSMIYGHADLWEPHHLNSGEKLYQLDMGHLSGGFFIDEETYNNYFDAENGNFDVKRYCNDAEIAPYFDGTYKNHISEYEVGADGLDVAYGTCAENMALGTGGCSQIYVAENDRDQLTRTDYNLSISDEDRTIGTEKSDEIITNAVESNLPALGLAPRDQETMHDLVADHEELARDSQGVEQMEKNVFNTGNQENQNADLMSDIAPPETKADNAYGQSRAPEQDNSAEISR